MQQGVEASNVEALVGDIDHTWVHTFTNIQKKKSITATENQKQLLLYLFAVALLVSLLSPGFVCFLSFADSFVSIDACSMLFQVALLWWLLLPLMGTGGISVKDN